MSFSGIVANGASQKTENVLVENDGFFPDISSEQIREVIRLDASITNARLIHEIENAMLECNDLLSILKSRADTLHQLNTSTINGKGNKEILYFRAIAACCAALLLEKYRSYDSSGTGQNRADDVGISSAEHRRNQRYAIRDLLGQNRMTVDLL